EISQSQFSVDQYYFQEGQKLPLETVKAWLGRKSDSNPKGLNPAAGDSEEEQLANPIIFQQVAEYDFIDKDSQKLGGISLGIALNKVYYVGDQSTEIDQETMIQKGKETASELIKQIR